MKRILVVLLLLAVASLGFSVSGKVYGRYLANVNDGNLSSAVGWYDSEPWVKYTLTPLADLRVGRQGTGVSVNFDSFTLDYKLRRPINTAENWSGNWGLNFLKDYYNAITGFADDLKATSPGYINVSGLKLGPVDLSIGGSWWTLQRSYSEMEEIGGTKTLDFNASVGYNMFAFDLTYSIQAGDARIYAAPWNKVSVAFFGGEATGKEAVSDTDFGKGSVSGYGAIIPLVIDYSMESLSVTLHCKAFLGGESTKVELAGASDTISSGSTELGAVLKVSYVINELFGVFGVVGYVMSSASQTEDISGTKVADVSDNYSMIPLMGGLTITPSPALTFNLGTGYAVITGKEKDNILGLELEVDRSRFQTQWDNYEVHGYFKPLIKFAADTKFAGDWGAGLTYIVYLNDTVGTGHNGGNTDQSETIKYSDYYKSVVKQSDWLNFNNIPDWDALGGSCAYISYSKDNYETKAWFGANAASPANNLAGMFAAIDIGIKY